MWEAVIVIPSPAELTCQEFVEVAGEFLESAVDAEGRARLEQHLLVCTPCKVYLDQIRQTAAMLNQVPQSDETSAPQPSAEALALLRKRKP